MRASSSKLAVIGFVVVLLSSSVSTARAQQESTDGVIAPQAITAVTPTVILDTRAGDKVGELDGSGAAYELLVIGQGGVPSSGVSAVALNVTAVSTETNYFGFVTVYPCGTRPDTSNLYLRSGKDARNSFIASLSAAGKVCFYVYGKAHLIVETYGYYLVDDVFEPISPTRILDSRDGEIVS